MTVLQQLCLLPACLDPSQGIGVLGMAFAGLVLLSLDLPLPAASLGKALILLKPHG